jgi:glycosyltransferase involved in cell wall biosynthesis
MIHNRYLQRGGEDQSTEAEVAILRAHGHEVVLHEEHNTRVQQLGNVRTAGRVFWSAESYRRIGETLDADRFDIVHVQNHFPLISPAAHWTASRRNIPVVQSLRNYRLLCANALLYRDSAPCHDCLNRRIPWPAVLHRCYRGSRLGSAAVAGSQLLHRGLGTWNRCVDTFIALTSFSRDIFVDAGIPRDRIVVKPNFLRTDPGPGAGGVGFLFVGRLAEEKGVLTLLRAWKELPPGAELEIVGDGPLASEVRRHADEARNIRWSGALPHAAVMNSLGGARAAIMPSEWYETFGRLIIEAYARGTPVIASSLGAMKELVIEERTGLLFSPGDPTDLARQVTRLMDAPSNWMRDSARAEFESAYQAGHNYRSLMKIYEHATAIRRARNPGSGQERA